MQMQRGTYTCHDAAMTQRAIMAMRLLCSLVMLCASGCALLTSRPTPRDPTGSIIGLARDLDSQDPIAFASVELRAHGELKSRVTKTSDRGLYDFSRILPGLYTLTATFAGQVIDVSNVRVVQGEAVAVDLTFTLGHPDPITVSFGNAQDGAILRYRTKQPVSTAIIEGTLTDNVTRGRIVGAVISVIEDGKEIAAGQIISDENGRFRFDGLQPGTYALSSYYAIPNRGQMELRRSDITVQAGEGVVVPLWIDISK
jgi:uncharacterized surface anchored protein